MDSGTDVSRREILRKLIGAITAAATASWRIEAGRAHPRDSGMKTPLPAVTAVGTENPHFFACQEKEVIATVAELIIPTDEVSLGARAAGVHDWIDFLVANSPATVQQQWREGLAALDHASEESAGRKFLKLDPVQQRKLLEQFVQHEDAPATPGERFFVLAKEATVNGYYTSEIGLMKDLRYRGGSYAPEPDVSCPAKSSNK